MTKRVIIRKQLLKLLTVLFILFFCFSVHAENNTAWTKLPPIPTNTKHSAGRYLNIYLAPNVLSTDGILTLAKKNAFKSQTKDVYNVLTSIEKPVWFYFKTDSVNYPDGKLLVIENCNLNLVSLYEYQNGQLKLIRTKGMSLPYQHDNSFPEQINFPVKSNTIYFVEAYDLYNASFPLFVRDPIQNTQVAVIKNLFNAFYWGIVFIMATVAFLFFIRSREKVFIYYALFLYGTIMLNLCLDGYLFAYLWPNMPSINNYKFSLFAMSAVTTPFFVYYFLEIKTYYPKIKFFFIVMTVCFFIVCLLNIIGWYKAAMYVLQSTAFTQIVIYLLYGTLVWKKGNRNALYFILAWSAYLISILLTVLSVANVIPGTPYINNYVQIGTLIQGGIFSFIIAGKYQTYKSQHILYQEKIIEVLKEREYLLTTQNDTLETTVYLRTEELKQKNAELNLLNKSLNEVVATKTLELKKSLDEINETNKQLEQFNFITSHNLRGPLSTLQGLYELYYQEKNPEEKLLYIDKSFTVINRMDEILKDLNKILSYKTTEKIKESVDFETIISNNLKQLEIKRIHVNLYVDPSLEISGIKSFYESIFYNLFSNAQKYKHAQRELRIDVQITKLTDTTFSIRITDNGIGMDATKIGDNLFGFYKRFHFHVEGKGLGLYITKSQVEILGGTIRSESELNVGTTFIIEIPC